MEIALIVLLVASVVLNYYLYGKMKEFESLFELSKGYEFNAQKAVNDIANSHFESLRLGRGYIGQIPNPLLAVPKLNKDGSIAKKRGRKPKNG
jgi:hypothetical protein